jgi:hypothetical protein
LNALVAPYTAADGSGNGTIDQADYNVWRAHFGQTVAAGSTEQGVGRWPT